VVKSFSTSKFGANFHSDSENLRGKNDIGFLSEEVNPTKTISPCLKLSPYSNIKFKISILEQPDCPLFE